MSLYLKRLALPFVAFALLGQQSLNNGSIGQPAVGGSSGVTTSSPLTGTTALACPTCTTSAAALTSGQIIAGAGGQAIAKSDLTGDVTTSGSMATTLAPVISAGSCGDTTHSCGLTYDAKGRLTAATNNTIATGSTVSTGSLTSAQVLALSTTPITLVAAQGSGTLIVVDSIAVEQVYSGTAYTFTGTLSFRYTNGAGPSLANTCASSILTSAATEICIVTALTTLVAGTSITNDAIVISASAAPTVGTGTLSYAVKYHVVTGF
jgi:hypothetical protein